MNSFLKLPQKVKCWFCKTNSCILCVLVFYLFVFSCLTDLLQPLSNFIKNKLILLCFSCTCFVRSGYEGIFYFICYFVTYFYCTCTCFEYCIFVLSIFFLFVYFFFFYDLIFFIRTFVGISNWIWNLLHMLLVLVWP